MKLLKGKHPLIYAVIVSNGVSLALFGLRVSVTRNDQYWFLFWNLVLAWVPLVIVVILLRMLKKQSWREPSSVAISILALSFLPNSFYVISDLIHLQDTGDIGVLYDSVLFMSIIMNGFFAGMTSVYLVHKALLKRLNYKLAHLTIGGIFLSTSFAIYLGRSLRWNTWDIVAHPFGVLYDVSERIINPLSHPQVIGTTFTFFLLLSSTYAVLWYAARYLEASKK